MTLPSAPCAFFKIALLQITEAAIIFFVHGDSCMYSSFCLAQYRALEVQPLRGFVTKFADCIVAPPFLGYDKFETVKYCQM